MHERSDTLLYEIDMLRHCESKLKAKDTKAQEELNLCIEGFLLHLRNLLAFFTNRGSEDTDLTINRPEEWAGRAESPHDYADLTKAAKQADHDYRGNLESCFALISKYLLHCTTLRHARALEWKIRRIFADFDPTLREFERRFFPTSEKPPEQPTKP